MAVMTRHIEGNLQTARSDSCLLVFAEPNTSKYQKVQCAGAEHAGAEHAGDALPGPKVPSSDDHWRVLTCIGRKVMTKTARTDGCGSANRVGSTATWGADPSSTRKGHSTVSKEEVAEDKPSKFQASYPGKSTNYQGSMSRGWLQDVIQYVGIAFDRQNAQAVQVLCHEQQGLFEWKPHLHMPATMTATMPATMPMTPTRYAQVTEHGGVPVRIVL
jgi:hypothetical protein